MVGVQDSRLLWHLEAPFRRDHRLERSSVVRQPILSDGARGRYGGKCSTREHEVSHNGGNVSKSSRRAEAARNQVAPAAEDFVHAAADRVGPLVRTAAERVA